MKRCCETCRFFDKGTLAGSGWCRHPERVEATSDLVLVRASQLTCRKGWDKDYWEPMARSSRSVDRIARATQIGPVPPASPEDIDAIVNAGRNSDGERAVGAASVEEDRVVGATPSPLTHVPKSLISKHLPPAPEPSPLTAQGSRGPNSREKILIAKEEVARKRISNRIRPAVEPLPSPVVAPSSPNLPANGSEQVESIGAEPAAVPENFVEPVVDDNVRSPAESQITSREDRPVLPFDVLPGPPAWDDEPLVPSIPPTFDHWNYPADRHPPFLWLVQGINSKRAEDSARRDDDDAGLIQDSQSDGVVAHDVIPPGAVPFELPPPVDTTFLPPGAPAREKPRQRKQRHSFTFRSRWTDSRERPPRRGGVPPPPREAAPAWEGAPEWADELHVTPMSLPSEAALPALDDHVAGIPLAHVEDPLGPEELPVRSADWIMADDFGWSTASSDGQYADRDAIGVDLALQRSPVAGEDSETAFSPSSDHVVVRGNESGPLLYDPEIDDYVLAPNVPRMCRTCAEFRPAEDGERGWCSNGWAFNNRLLVSAWDVPCQTSFGNWWIPNDDHWNDRFYDRLHAPAPLFDLLMAQRTPQRREKPHAKKRWS